MAEATANSAPARPYSVLVDYPAYRWFYAGQGASLIGTWSQAAAARWIVYGITQSERAVGMVDAVEMLPGLLVGLLAGAAADRVSGRAMLMAMQVGQAVMAFTLASMVGGGSVKVWQLATLLALSQVFVTFEEPSRQVFQRELVGRSRIGHAIALETGLFNVARVLGPAMAGLFLSLVGRASPFAFNGCSFLAALVILWRIKHPPKPEGDDDPPAAEASGEGGSSVLAGFSQVWHNRRIFWIFVLLSFFSMAGMGYTSLIPAYAEKTLGSSTGGYSSLQVGGGIGSTLGAFAVAALAASKRRDLLVSGGMALAGGSLILAGLVPGWVPRGWALPTAVGFMFFNGLGTIAVFATAQTLIQAAAPDEIRGRVVGLWMIVYSGSMPIGSLACGSLGQWLGVVPVMVGSGILCVGVGTLVVGSSLLVPTAEEQRSGEV